MILPGLLPGPQGGGGAQAPGRLREAARALEAQVFAQLLRPAFEAASDPKSPFGGGAAEAQWRPALLDAVAASAASRPGGGALGLQEMFLRQMLRLQESGVQASSSDQRQESRA